MESVNEIEKACRMFKEAATYLLPVCERNAMQILQTIVCGKNIHSLTAKITIDEWEKGNLILYLIVLLSREFYK